MSFSEILAAVKALPRGEQVSMMEAIKEDVGELTPEEVLLAKYFPPGATFEVWFPESNPAGVAAALQALQIGEKGEA